MVPTSIVPFRDPMGLSNLHRRTFQVQQQVEVKVTEHYAKFTSDGITGYLLLQGRLAADPLEGPALGD
jgi:hypothetical protein